MRFVTHDVVSVKRASSFVLFAFQSHFRRNNNEICSQNWSVFSFMKRKNVELKGNVHAFFEGFVI